MQTSDFYQDRRYCPRCRVYVQYLLSPKAAYCVVCGGAVRLFSREDWERFLRVPAAKSA